LKVILIQLWAKSMFSMSVNFNDAVFDNVLNLENVLNTRILRALINQSFTLLFDLSLILLNFSQLTTIIAWSCLTFFEIFTSASLITLIYCWRSWHLIEWWRLKITFVNDWSKNLKCSQFFLNHKMFNTIDNFCACLFIWVKCSIFWTAFFDFLLIRVLCRLSRSLIAMIVQCSRWRW
jgi:hypothetical protein